VAGILLVVSLGLWAGGAVFFSFVAAPRIFSYLRDELPSEPPPGVHGLDSEIGLRLAGSTVGEIFPTYFAAQIGLGVIAAGAAFVTVRRGSSVTTWRCALTAGALAVVTIHSFTVYPRSVRVLDEHYETKAAGDEPRAKELRKTFGMWHGISQSLNVVTISLVVVALMLAGVVPSDPK
jgi:acyl phosphate:glycerol-3-phosphate acyltransferase